MPASLQRWAELVAELDNLAGLVFNQLVWVVFD